MREIVLDTETTGLEPSQGHRIIEIGCVEMIHKRPTGQVFHYYLNPERDVPEEAQRIHGITTVFLLDKPLFADIAREFLNFIGNDPLVIHNAVFDIKFLNAELMKINCDSIPYSRAIDTMLMARTKFPGLPASLDALCRRFNIDHSHRTHHGAMLDAELLCEVYFALTGGSQGALELGKESRESGNAKPADSPDPVTNVLSLCEFSPTPQELADHREFLKKIKAPLWNAVES